MKEFPAETISLTAMYISDHTGAFFDIAKTQAVELAESMAAVRAQVRATYGSDMHQAFVSGAIAYRVAMEQHFGADAVRAATCACIMADR